MASGSGEEHGRPWAAASSWAPAGGASVEGAVSFETSADDAETTPSAVLLVRPPSDGDGSPCEVTVNFRGKYEIHRVYVRSTARIYEIYYSTDPKNNSKDYLCTVRCGPVVREEPVPSGESMVQWSGHTAPIEKHEHETKSVSSSGDDDSWVEVKIPESPVKTNTVDSQERNASRNCQKNTLVHYEATVEITDASPCVSLTLRLLSLQSKTSVHIEEVYIFADPVEATNDDSVPGPGNMGGSSLLAMLVPSLMQMSKSRNLKIDDRYFSDGSRAQLSQGSAIKERSLCGNMVQVAGMYDSNDSKFKMSGMAGNLNPTDGGIESNEKKNQDECPSMYPKSIPLPKQTTEKIEVPLSMDHKISLPDQPTSPLRTEYAFAYNRIEKMLDTLLCKVENMELYYSRFEDNILRPLGGIEARLQRLEQQFDSFSVDIQSLRGPCARMPAPEFSCDTTHSQDKTHNDGDGGTSASITNRQPGLAVKAPDFSLEDSCGYDVEADENLVTLHGTNMVPRLLVKAPEFSLEDCCGYAVEADENLVTLQGTDMVPRLLVKAPEFICEPEYLCNELHEDPFSQLDSGLSSAKGRKTCPGLAVKVPEFPNDEDDEVEEDKEAEVELGDHDNGHVKSVDTLDKSTVESSKGKAAVSIEGALASALESFLTSTKGTSSSKSVPSTVCYSSAGNTNDASCSFLSPGRVNEISTKHESVGQSPGISGDENKVGTLASYQEVDEVPDTSLRKSNLDDKGCEEVDAQNIDLNLGKIAFIASKEPLEVLFQPPNVSESIDEGAQVNENRPLSMAEFLAVRIASSCDNSTSNIDSGDDGAEVRSLERDSVEGGENCKEVSDNNTDQKNDIGQLFLRKIALEVDEDETKVLDNALINSTFEGLSYVAPDNGANGHNTSAIEAVSDEDEGLETTENIVWLSDERETTFYHPTFLDSNKRWIENSSSDSSLDEMFTKPKVQLCWSNGSSVESLDGAPYREAVSSGTTATANSVNQDLIPGIGLSSTAAPIAGPGEELQKVCDLLYHYKDDLLHMNFVEREIKSSHSLEVLLGELSDSEAQVSTLEDNDNGAGFSSAQLFTTLSSSEDTTTAMNEPLVDVVYMPKPSETHASARNEPLVDVDYLPKPSENFAGGSNGEYPDSLI